MEYRELKKITIFPKIKKYRKIKLKKVIMDVVRLLLLPITAVLIICIIFTIPDSIETEGVIEPPNKQVIFSKVNAAIEEIYVINGSRISNGTLLITFNSNDIINDYNKLYSSFINLSNQLETTQFELSSFLLEYGLELKQVETEYNKKLRLYKKEYISSEEFQRIKYQWELTKLKKYKSSGYSNQLAGFTANMDSTMREIELNLQTLSNTSISSSISGIVVFEDEKYIRGYETRKGEMILQILPDEKVIAKILIPESMISRVKIGQKVEIYPTAFPKDKYKGLDGELYYLSPNAIQGYFTGKIKLEKDIVKVRSDNVLIEKNLSYGMTLSARIITGKKPIYKILLGINEY